MDKKINISQYNENEIPQASHAKVGIVVSEWNKEVTEMLLEGCLEVLKKGQVKEENITIKWVPGSFELPLAAQLMARYRKVNSIICLGCIIQGETRHFEFICNAVSNQIMKIGISYNIPVIFGVLTPNTIEQALDRVGGKHGNKGIEAGITALKMMKLKTDLKNGF